MEDLVRAQTRVEQRIGQRQDEGSILFDIRTEATTDGLCRFIYYCKMYGAMLGESGRPTISAARAA